MDFKSKYADVPTTQEPARGPGTANINYPSIRYNTRPLFSSLLPALDDWVNPTPSTISPIPSRLARRGAAPQPPPAVPREAAVAVAQQHVGVRLAPHLVGFGGCGVRTLAAADMGRWVTDVCGVVGRLTLRILQSAWRVRWMGMNPRLFTCCCDCVVGALIVALIGRLGRRLKGERLVGGLIVSGRDRERDLGSPPPRSRKHPYKARTTTSMWLCV